MNVGIVTTWFERGAAYVSRAYMESLSARHNVFIYARSGNFYAKGDPIWDKDYVTWGKKVPGRILTYIDWKDFKKWAVTNRLDAIIFNEQQSWEVIFRTIEELNVTIGTYVDYYKKESVPLFRAYDFLICNTKRHHSVFKDHPNAFYIRGARTSTFSNPRRDRVQAAR